MDCTVSHRTKTKKPHKFQHNTVTVLRFVYLLPLVRNRKWSQSCQLWFPQRIVVFGVEMDICLSRRSKKKKKQAVLRLMGERKKRWIQSFVCSVLKPGKQLVLDVIKQMVEKSCSFLILSQLTPDLSHDLLSNKILFLVFFSHVLEQLISCWRTHTVWKKLCLRLHFWNISLFTFYGIRIKKMQYKKLAYLRHVSLM